MALARHAACSVAKVGVAAKAADASSPVRGRRLLLPSFRAMAALVASDAIPAAGVPVKVLNVLEAFLEVLAR